MTQEYPYRRARIPRMRNLRLKLIRIGMKNVSLRKAGKKGRKKGDPHSWRSTVVPNGSRFPFFFFPSLSRFLRNQNEPHPGLRPSLLPRRTDFATPSAPEKFRSFPLHTTLPSGPVAPSHSPPSRRFSPSITRVKAISQLVLRPASAMRRGLSPRGLSPMYFSKERFSLAKRGFTARRQQNSAGGADRRTQASENRQVDQAGQTNKRA